VGISLAAKRGILFKEATFLETMAKSDMLALDKTGTITEGKPSVVDAILEEGFDPELLYAVVESSNHPVSRGIKAYLEKSYENISPKSIEQIHALQAKGVEATYQGKRVLGGNARLLAEYGIELDFKSEHTLFAFTIGDHVVARFGLRDKIRPGAKEAIDAIKKMGIRVVMLTGDHPQSAQTIAEEVGIEEVHARLLPQEKAALIDRFHEEGHIVVMAGDGINDAIALARSDIAIAMGNGADVAISVSDVVLLDESPLSLHSAFRISGRTFRAVKENLAFSLLYNLIAVPLAVAGYVNPLIAALSMSLSSLVVVGNSLRIRRG
jgi:Cu+-exporting ATPase